MCKTKFDRGRSRAIVDLSVAYGDRILNELALRVSYRIPFITTDKKAFDLSKSRSTFRLPLMANIMP